MDAAKLLVLGASLLGFGAQAPAAHVSPHAMNVRVVGVPPGDRVDVAVTYRGTEGSRTQDRYIAGSGAVLFPVALQEPVIIDAREYRKGGSDSVIERRFDAAPAAAVIDFSRHRK